MDFLVGVPPEKRARIFEEEPLNLSIKKNDEISTEAEELQIGGISCAKDTSIELHSPPVPYHISHISELFLAIECQLSLNISYGLKFSPPVEYLYSPVEYAFDVHAKYVRKYCGGTKKLLFLGMNAGPWGMSQTGVPFGEISVVKNWLGLSGFVGKPLHEHPSRKITGFSCRRSEISGKRFWSLMAKLCSTPDHFFRHSFAHNYCPVAFMDAAGRNITPVELKGVEQKALQLLCDEALIAVIKLLDVQKIIGVGRFAEKRARAVVTGAGLSTDILYIPHPSPRSRSNINWVESTSERLGELDLLHFFSEESRTIDVSGNA